MKTNAQAMEWLLNYLVEHPYEISLIHIQEQEPSQLVVCVAHIDVGLTDTERVLRQAEYEISRAIADTLVLRIQWLNGHAKFIKFTRETTNA